MRCPRCYTILPEQATHCANCDLPEPKGEAASGAAVVIAEVDDLTTAAVDAQAVAMGGPQKPVEKIEPSRSIYAEKIPTARPHRKIPPQPSPMPSSAKPVRTKQASESRARARRLALLAGLPIIVSLIAGVIYLYVLPTMKPEKVEPQTAVMALTRLRQMKSNDAWLTVDERMMLEVQRFRKEGKLRGYRGWGVSEVEGDKTKLLVMFTLDEVSGEQQRAVWLTDLVTNTYTPQTELAVAVYNR